MKTSIDQVECTMDNHHLNIDHLIDNTQRDRNQMIIIIHHEAHSQYMVEMHIMVDSNFQVLEMKLEVHALTITML